MSSNEWKGSRWGDGQYRFLHIWTRISQNKTRTVHLCPQCSVMALSRANKVVCPWKQVQQPAGTACWTQLSEKAIKDNKRLRLPFSSTPRHTEHNMEDSSSSLGCLNLITPSKIISYPSIVSVCCICIDANVNLVEINKVSSYLSYLSIYLWNLSKYTCNGNDILIKV